MTKHRPAKACPRCGSEDVRFALKSEEPAHLLVLRRFRKCNGCGSVFLVMSPRSNAVFLIISGVVLAAPIVHSIVCGPTVIDFIVAGLALLWPLSLLVDGLRGLGKSSQGRQNISG